ncbi:MAG: hydroxyacid dehydrogenase [Chloroflexi bacterium]|nr:hydroxyacid dehydrogenase [Chloroflexota bacterium]
MKPKVWLAFDWPEEIVARLAEVAEVILNEAERLPGVDVVVVRYADGAFMDNVGPNLKLIARSGIGVDGVDIAAATERGILITNTPDAPTESTAEHAVALLLAIAKRVIVGDMQLRGADLPRSAMVGTEVKGRTLGVVGYGRIGRRVAEICALGLRMKVLAYDPFLTGTPPTPEGVTLIHDLDTLLTQAEFVTLHTPLTSETLHLIGARELRLMKSGSYLINASRGPVVDEAALIEALQSGHLASAGLDVFDPEPPEPDNPLLKMTNVVLTPHIASSTQTGLSAMLNGAVDQILQVLAGQRPTCLVNSEAWPGRVKLRGY